MENGSWFSPAGTRVDLTHLGQDRWRADVFLTRRGKTPVGTTEMSETEAATRIADLERDGYVLVAPGTDAPKAPVGTLLVGAWLLIGFGVLCAIAVVALLLS